MTDQPNPADPPADEPATGQTSEAEAAIPAEESTDRTLPPPSPPPPRRRRSFAPLIYGLGTLVIAAAVYFLVAYPWGWRQSGNQADQVAALENQVRNLQSELSQLQARPPGDPGKLAALTQRVDALSNAKPPPPPPAPDLGPIEKRLAALEQRPVPDLHPIEQRLSALEQKVAALSAAPKGNSAGNTAAADGNAANAANTANAAQLAALTRRVDSLSQQLNGLSQQVAQAAPAAQRVDNLSQSVASLSQTVTSLGQRVDGAAQKLTPIGDQVQKLAHQQQDLVSKVQGLKSTQPETASLSQRVTAEQAAIASLQGAVQKLEATTAQTQHQARIDAALAALDAGRPLGTVPNAPPAVARFADHPPPTLAELRAEFPKVARQALKVSQSSTANRPFLDRVWSNAQDLVTVRQGDQVIVGDPASGIVSRAQSDLDLGDLEAAVNALSALNGPAYSAFSGWVASAKSLLQARAALLGMMRPA